MLKKKIPLFLALVLLTGCGGKKEIKQDFQEAPIAIEEAHNLFTIAADTVKNAETQFIHNKTSVNMGNSEIDPATSMAFTVDATINKSIKDQKDYAKIKVVQTDYDVATETTGTLKGNSYTYVQNNTENAEIKSYDELLQELLVYDINIDTNYISEATMQQNSQNYKQVNITIDNTSGKDFVQTVMPELKNTMDIDTDIRYDNIYVEYLLDDKNELIYTIFNIQVTFLNGDNEIPYTINIEREFTEMD